MGRPSRQKQSEVKNPPRAGRRENGFPTVRTNWFGPYYQQAKPPRERSISRRPARPSIFGEAKRTARRANGSRITIFPRKTLSRARFPDKLRTAQRRSGTQRKERAAGAQSRAACPGNASKARHETNLLLSRVEGSAARSKPAAHPSKRRWALAWRLASSLSRD